jgi:DNA-directed RNA polymerase subunit RPC12/RpoP
MSFIFYLCGKCGEQIKVSLSRQSIGSNGSKYECKCGQKYIIGIEVQMVGKWD